MRFYAWSPRSNDDERFRKRRHEQQYHHQYRSPTLKLVRKRWELAQHKERKQHPPAWESPDTKNIVRTYRAGALIAAILLKTFAYIKSQG
jgi:hypothetical protein